MAMTPVLPAPHQSARLNSHSTTDMKLLDAAKKLEATFLAEMLKSAGFGTWLLQGCRCRLNAPCGI